MPQTLKQLAATRCEGQMSIEEAMTEPPPTVVQFRKKPITVSAIQYDGTNHDEVAAFCGQTNDKAITFRPVRDYEVNDRVTALVWDKLHSSWVGVKDGDWVVRGLRGENYPIDGLIITETYDRIAEDA